MRLCLECLIQTFLIFETFIVSALLKKKNFFFSFFSKSVLTVAHSWHRHSAPKLQS